MDIQREENLRLNVYIQYTKKIVFDMTPITDRKASLNLFNFFSQANFVINEFLRKMFTLSLSHNIQPQIMMVCKIFFDSEKMINLITT